MELAVSFPSAPVIDTETRSPTLMPLMLVTFPVIVVARVTAAVIAWPPPSSVIDVALTAVTGPPISRRSVAPGGSDWPPPPSGARCVPPPAPLEGAALEPPLGALALGVALAAAGLPVTSCRAPAPTPTPAAAATTAVRAKSQPRLVPFPPPGYRPSGGYPG